MADREQPYDPYIPSGGAQPGAGAQAGGNQRTAALQAVRASFRLIPTSRLPVRRRQATIVQNFQTRKQSGCCESDLLDPRGRCSLCCFSCYR
jgi:hypothetical protein